MQGWNNSIKASGTAPGEETQTNLLCFLVTTVALPPGLISRVEAFIDAVNLSNETDG
jgi:hypothetical protein